MKTALVIMAAGVGSRFGGGIKQLEPVGKHGEVILEYSIHDAIEAGFNKIIFIIRKDIEPYFQDVMSRRILSICQSRNIEIQYAYQSLEDVPEGVSLPTDRTKPWGTGQAVLSCKELIDCPFAVINADDYYGKEAFVRVQEFLKKYDPKKPNHLCMAGFILKNTLSENGGVTRGVCNVDTDGYLSNIVETYNIIKTEDGATVSGEKIDVDSFVSMNMWGLTPEFLKMLEKGFEEFFEHIEGNELKAEYLLPTYIGQLLKEGSVSVKVLPTSDKWFGVTYKEDKPIVVEALQELVNMGIYKEELFSDICKI